MTEVDTGSCWYSDANIAEMQNFYLTHRNNGEITRHLETFKELLATTGDTESTILDLGCGTAWLTDFCGDRRYIGVDLDHVIKKCAIINYPNNGYMGFDLTSEQEPTFIDQYKIVVMNGFIDVMQHPLLMLNKILNHCTGDVIIHRQEITEQGETKVLINGSYGGYTYHSIISRKDFIETLEANSFDIIKESNLYFTNWENNGTSFLLRKRKSWALYKMDYELNKIFNSKRRGFFIEAGACDGLSQSNTMYLELYKNWYGILIEPVVENYNKCVAERSRGNVYVNAALVSDDYDTDQIAMIYTPESGGLLSVVDNENAARLMLRAREDGTHFHANATTLNKILEANEKDLPEIDLLILDVEGYELNALRGLDLKKWKIGHLLIEELETNSIIADYLYDYYQEVAVLGIQNHLYKRREQPLN